jgi:hypothetical protein
MHLPVLCYDDFRLLGGNAIGANKHWAFYGLIT